jgi:flagellar biosynthesis protein FlhB
MIACMITVLALRVMVMCHALLSDVLEVQFSFSFMRFQFQTGALGYCLSIPFLSCQESVSASLQFLL